MDHCYSLKYREDTFSSKPGEEFTVIKTESGEIIGRDLRPTFKKLLSMLGLKGSELKVVKSSIECEKVVEGNVRRYAISIEKKSSLPTSSVSYLVKYIEDK